MEGGEVSCKHEVCVAAALDGSEEHAERKQELLRVRVMQLHGECFRLPPTTHPQQCCEATCGLI